MENTKHKEAQQKATKQSAIVFLLILVGPVCVAGIIVLSIVFVSTHPLRGLHFLLPQSLYLYLFFLLNAVLLVVSSFFEARKSGYKIKKILSAFFFEALFIFYFFIIL